MSDDVIRIGKPKNRRKITVVIAGDTFPMPMNEDLFIEGDSRKLFGNKFYDMFHEADFSVCNLEGVLTDSDVKKNKSGVRIKASTAAVRAYRDLGVSMVSIANNHTMDYGAAGLADTVSVLEANGIAWAGAGNNENEIVKHRIVKIGRLKIAFYCVAETLFNIPTEDQPGVNIYDEYRVCSDIRELKRICNYVVVIYHGGAERTHCVSPAVYKRFHRMADCGADILISNHTHALGEEEYYNGSYCLYGQGNFHLNFSGKPSELNKNGILLEVGFTRNGFEITKHLSKREDPCITDSKAARYRNFEARSARLQKGYCFREEYSEYSAGNLYRFLNACCCETPEMLKEKETLSKKEYNELVMSKFTKRQLLTLLKYLEAEEFREYAIQGLKDRIDKM